MGIQGLLSFITRNNFLEPYQLRNTNLVIDGMNLEYELCRRYLERCRDDRAFGGDYNHYGAFISAFFQQLLDCKVTPVVILDGSFKLSKLPTKRERFDKQLEAVKAIYGGDHTAGADIVPLMSSYLFVQVIKRMEITVKKTIFEADDVIPVIAAELYAPILSADSDFLLCNLPAGIVHMKKLMEGELKVEVDEATGEKYLPCHLYRVAHLGKRYPNLTPELINAAGVLLGNDHHSRDDSRGILKRLVELRLGDKSGAPEQGNVRQTEIDAVFSWLSTMRSVEAIKDTILTQVWAKSHITVALERMPRLGNPRVGPPTFSVNWYFESKKDSLFKMDRYFRADNNSSFKKSGGSGAMMMKPRSGGYPVWVFDNLVKEVIPRRLVSIYSVQVEFLRPLVEDFSLEHSSYETVFELNRYIYGLLRSEETNPMLIKRYVRVRDRRYDVKEEPECYLPKTQLDFNTTKMVPRLHEIGQKLKPDLSYYFFLILQLDSSVLDQVKRLCIITNSSGISAEHLRQLKTLILALIYFSRHFSYGIGIEFIYAFFGNIMLLGHLDDDCGNGSKSLCPPVFTLLPEERQKLTAKLEPFLKPVPTFTENAYQPRIVHQYNAYQNCLSGIIFLATILRLEKEYHVDTLISGLQGTFIYSLTVALSFEEKPLAYLEENILNDHGFSKHLPLFRQLLDLTLEHSTRRYVAYQLEGVDRSVLPPVVPRFDAKGGGEEHQLFMHCRSHWVLKPGAAVI